MAFDPAIPSPPMPPEMPGGGMLGAPPQGQALVPAPAAPPYAGKLHDVTIARVRKIERCVCEPVPPEEFGVSRRSRSPRAADLDYCYHETRVRASDLVAQGFDEEEVKKIPSAETDDTTESISRNTIDDTNAAARNETNDATREVKITEHYARLDYEGDGRPRLYKVVTAAGTNDILTLKGKPAIEQIDCVPFATITPIMMPHRFHGRSIADVVIDIQKIKTALTRQMLDNAYFANNQRIEVGEEFVTKHTIDDLLSNRPGGLVRTKRLGGLQPIPNQDISVDILRILEYADATREWRSGVTRQGQGIDADVLQNVGQDAVLQVLDMAQQRMRFIARVFAETGIKDLFWLVHTTIRRNDRRGAYPLKLRGKWVEVNPKDWQNRKDLTVNVGLGTGGRKQQIAFLLALLGLQKEAMSAPAAKLVKPDNIYNTLKRLTQLGGLKNVDDYFTDPATRAEEPVPPDPEAARVQGEMQLAQAKQQGDLQVAQQKAQISAQSEAEKLGKAAETERAQAEADIETNRRKAENTMAVERQKFEMERNLALLQFFVDSAKPQPGADGVARSPISIPDLISALQQIGAALPPVGGPLQSGPSPEIAALQTAVAQLAHVAAAPVALTRDAEGRLAEAHKVL